MDRRVTALIFLRCATKVSGERCDNVIYQIYHKSKNFFKAIESSHENFEPHKVLGCFRAFYSKIEAIFKKS